MATGKKEASAAASSGTDPARMLTPLAGWEEPRRSRGPCSDGMDGAQTPACCLPMPRHTAPGFPGAALHFGLGPSQQSPMGGGTWPKPGVRKHPLPPTQPALYQRAAFAKPTVSTPVDRH